MNMYGGSGGIFPPAILNHGTRWGGREWSALRPCPFTPGERASGIHRIRGRVDPRASLDAEAKRKKILFLPGMKPQLSNP